MGSRCIPVQSLHLLPEICYSVATTSDTFERITARWTLPVRGFFFQRSVRRPPLAVTSSRLTSCLPTSCIHPPSCIKADVTCRDGFAILDGAFAPRTAKLNPNRVSRNVRITEADALSHAFEAPFLQGGVCCPSARHEPRRSQRHPLLPRWACLSTESILDSVEGGGMPAWWGTVRAAFLIKLAVYMSSERCANPKKKLPVTRAS